MNQKFKLLIAILSLLAASSCSLPLKVDQVKSMKDEVKGVRYILKRPVYVAGLRIDIKDTQFLVAPKWVAKKYSEFENGDLKDKDLNVFSLLKTDDKGNLPEINWATARSINDPQELYCIRVDSQNEQKELMPFLDVTLRQDMERDQLIYEATSRDTPPHWFADSESSITLDDKGFLTAIMAGEDDKSLEFIQAVAGLAISAATAAVAKNDGQCLLIKDKKFHKYVTEHIQLAALKSSLSGKLNDTLKNLDSTSPEQMKNMLESVSLLRNEIERVNERLEIVQYEIPNDNFAVQEVERDDEGKVTREVKTLVEGKKDKTWIKFELTSQ